MTTSFANLFSAVDNESLQYRQIIDRSEDFLRLFCGQLPEHEQRWEDDGGAT